MTIQDLGIRIERTKFGSIALTAADASYSSPRPVVLMIAGALRDRRTLLDWPGLLREHADVVIAELPGHGRSPDLIPATFDDMVRIFDAVIGSIFVGREVIIVGESLGGLVGIALATLADRPQKAVIAMDPPMTTAKLWSVSTNLRSVIQQHPDNAFLPSFAKNIFGVGPSSVVERIYYGLLACVKIPVHIATGDQPLLPPRRTDRPPCVFDEVDRYVVETFFGERAKVRRVENCGHLLLNEKPEACLRIIADVIASVQPAP